MPACDVAERAVSARAVLLAQLALALAGAAAWAAAAWRRRRATGAPRWRGSSAPPPERGAPARSPLASVGQASPRPRWRAAAWCAVTALGLLAYTGFGRFHSGRLLHVWDSYHYFIGAKYFAELGYQGLYECTAVADAEAGLRRQVATNTITDLRTNLQVRTFDVLIHPEGCLRRFSAARWAGFARDVAWFRARVDGQTWRRMQRDHGYNATPVWHLVGARLANLGPASDELVGALAMLDPLLLAGALVLVGWAFGLRAVALAALVLGTCYPARLYWTGGAILRLDYLACALAGLALLRRGRPALAGAALAHAALLRLFPAALLVGPALVAVAQLARARTLPRELRRLFAGALLWCALIVPPALAVAGDGGLAFVRNTQKHAATPLTNHMGLATALSYRPDRTVRALRSAPGHRPATLWPRFKEARRAAERQTWPVRALAVLAGLALLWRARRHELWRVSALGLVLVPAALSLTCYYYVFAVALAVLAERRPAAGAALLAWCAASLAVGLFLEPRVELDEAYAAQSALAVLGLGAVAALAVARPRWRRRAEGAEPLTTRTS